MNDISSNAMSRRFLLVHLGPTPLLLSHAEVRDIEGAERVDLAEAPLGGLGWIGGAMQRCPVYGLSSSFDLQKHAPVEDRLCVLLAHSQHDLAILCDKVDMVEVTETVHPLPANMRLPESPIESLVLRPAGLAYISSASRLVTSVHAQIQLLESTSGPGVNT